MPQSGGARILCIGAAHWDMIALADHGMPRGADRPGMIMRRPGGVALNLALALARRKMLPVLLSTVGLDDAGRALLAHARACGVETGYVHADPARPTGWYVAIEDPGGLVAAVAETAALDEAGVQLLAALEDGRLAAADAPWQGAVAVDGNLDAARLRQLGRLPALRGARLAVIAASPAKAPALRAVLAHPDAWFYLNRSEAEALMARDFDSAAQAAQALLEAGAASALVTDGAKPVAWAVPGRLLTARPRRVRAQRVSGAGDALVAAHLAAVHEGTCADTALERALTEAAAHVAGEPRS